MVIFFYTETSFIFILKTNSLVRMSAEILGAGAGAGAGAGGNQGLIQQITEIMGLPKGIAEEFLQMMDVTITQYPSQSYFENIVKMIPVPKFYQQSILIKSTPSENEIHVDEYNFSFRNQKFSRGAYGTVKPNKSRQQYVYKFMNVNNFTNESIKNSLKEPLINIILQQDPTVASDICRLYKVYCREIYTTVRNDTGYEGIPEEEYMYNTNLRGPSEEQVFVGYELIYKMENLASPALPILNKMFTKTDPEKNLRLLLKIYGPLYKTLQYLRETYRFEHGDLHLNNLMFEKNPMLSDGTLDESLLKVKMIDFGFANLEFEGEKIGKPHPRQKVEVEIFLWAAKKKILPNEFSEKLLSYGDDYLAMEKMILEESEKLSGGRRRKSRNKRKTRKTRKTKVYY